MSVIELFFCVCSLLLAPQAPAFVGVVEVPAIVAPVQGCHLAPDAEVLPYWCE